MPVATRQQVAIRQTSSSAPLFRHGVWLFAAFTAGMFAAFWPSYFSRLTTQGSAHAHQHGLVMILWCALLVSQGWLIRSGRRPLHRSLGVWSYVLVPLIVLTTVRFVHFRVRDLGVLGPGWLYSLALILNTVVVFVALYGLAMYHRRDRGTHARYMVSTVVPLFPPVADRLIFFYRPDLVPMFPQIGPDPVLPLFGFALGDAVLLGLAWWDWRANRRADVFPVALLLVLGCQAAILTFHQFGWWASFAAWFQRLPLT